MKTWLAHLCGGRLLLLALALASSASSTQAQYFEKSPEEQLRERVKEIREGWKRTPRPIDPDVENLKAAWKHRAAKIKTARIKWTLTRTDMAGSFNGVPMMNVHGAGMLPAVDTTTKMDFELLYKDGLVRLEERGQTWHADVEQPVDTHQVHAYGLDKLKYYAKTLDPAAYPYFGMIGPTDTVSHLASLDGLPLGMLLSPFDARISSWTDSGPIERSANQDDANGRCYQILRQGRSSSHGSHIWVSESQPGQLTRYESRRNDGSVRVSVEVDWKEMDGIGAVPASWTLVSLDDDGQIERVKENVITEIALNVPLTDADLDVVFPAGTQVVDLFKDAEFIANDAGELRPLSPNAALPNFGVPGAVGVSLIAIVVIVALLAFRRRYAS